MRDFKFFQRKERVFTDYMDAMDDYFLGGIRHATHVPRGQRQERPAPPIEGFDLNVIDAAVFGRIPSVRIAIERDSYTPSLTRVGTIEDLILGRFAIPWCFTLVIINRFTGGTVEINHGNVGIMNQRGLIFSSNDNILVRYKPD